MRWPTNSQQIVMTIYYHGLYFVTSLLCIFCIIAIAIPSSGWDGHARSRPGTTATDSVYFALNVLIPK